MSILGTVVASARSAISRLFRGSRPAAEQQLAASYDAARPGVLDAHWQFADRLSADAANRREVRHTLISRSRYENESNGYYAGMHQTHAVAIVGCGPRLRMQTTNIDFNQAVEREWEQWGAAVQLRRKLACMAKAWKKDGEVFAVLQNNPGIRNPVKLDFDPIEAEVCQSPYLPVGVAGRIDGIISDHYGNVIAYEILPAHPGSGQFVATQTPDVVPARNLLHLFSLDRPGQHRGVPACSSTLNVGASSRRFREAVVKHAEVAASQTSMLYTELSPNADESPATLQAMTSVPVVAGQQTVLPRGWKQDSFKSDQPKTGYAEFCKQQTAEAARPLGMPHSIAACDATDANFSSLKTNHLTYYAQVSFDRADVDDLVLERLFREWWIERELLRGKSLADVLSRPTPTHSFVWPVQPSADRQADAIAEDTKLRNGTLTLARAYSDAGLDVEDELAQMAADFGVTIDEMRRVLLFTFFPAAAQALKPQPAPTKPQSELDTELEEPINAPSLA
jgi:capsid protein